MTAEYPRNVSSSMSSKLSVHTSGALYSCPVKVSDGCPHSRVRKCSSAPSSGKRYR
jgi:hypothetical protein